ncbi:hypothetical protein MLD38_022594 [Melastoma candidum]|uniref:Uncharacterized protein n=1 Tax=Melastoma candidum TaxID=119954 RepID=A0ACB9QJS6_9MYRT|nr:hypothetical protein MLD38_022594 [Melastoma candidum]
MNKSSLLLLLLWLAVTGTLICVLVESRFMVYNTTSGVDPCKLNVHLVPHTHNDVGWLKTIDQYYIGSNNSIQGACVANILDSLVPALVADKNRKFIYVEQAFFQRWWREQSESVQDIVKQLVRSGQLEFINGGMCMHDEAATHYIDMIDQTTRGHRFILDTFGVGFDSLYYGRIDYQDRAMRKEQKSLEVVWRGSKSLGSSAQIFAGAFPENYNPPNGFSYEVNDDSPTVQDDINLFGYNVQERVESFVATAVSQANITRTNHLMWTMGTDFNYQYAHTWFKQMDKLIHYVNEDGRVNALYSTPSIYTDAKHAAKEAWPLKTEDFFPYAEYENAYYTGYFTSRPALKGYVRTMSGYYLAARQLEFFRGRNDVGPNTESLGVALAIAQHHDAVSGTEKQHVADDYTKRLSLGYNEAEVLVSTSLACLAESIEYKQCGSPSTRLQQCPLLNISYCPPSEADLSQGKTLAVVVYNSLGWKRRDLIRIPVKMEDISVQDDEGREVEFQLVPITDAYLRLRSYHAKVYLGNTVNDEPKYWLFFPVSVPPLGFSMYFISAAKGDAGSAKSRVDTFQRGDKSTIDIGQGNIVITFSSEKSGITHYRDRKNMVTEPIAQSYSFYTSFNGTDKDRRVSSAYIFRPSHLYSIIPEGKIPPTIVRGPLVEEVHQQISSWIYQIMRVGREKEHVEVEFIVGPIPADDSIGKEVVTQFTTSLETNKTFYTDSNGRDFLKRVRNHRGDWDLKVDQPVACNYYPINLGIFLEDREKEFSVLVDRSVGGSSLHDGQAELMLHRRQFNDGGLDEALNETVCASDKCKGLIIQGKYHFRFDRRGEGAKWRRSFGQEIYSPLLLAFAEQDGDHWRSTSRTTFSGIDSSYILPENVAVITLQELIDKSVLIRLAHLYEVGEDKDLSITASVELRKLFPGKKVGKVIEMSLSANQERSEMERKRLVWQAQGVESEEHKVSRGGPVDPLKLVVDIAPMEIRTFIVQFDNQREQ